MHKPLSISNRTLILAMMIFAAPVFFVGCRPDKEVTTDPYYNFSSFAGTVWKTKTKTAIASTGASPLRLLPPGGFDTTDPHYTKTPDLKLIAVLPPGTRLRITRLMQDQGGSGGVQVEGVVDDGTNAPKTVYVVGDFLANVRFASKGPTSNTNWGVNPDML